MKKLISLVLVLALVVASSLALANGSVTVEDKNTGTATPTYSYSGTTNTTTATTTTTQEKTLDLSSVTVNVIVDDNTALSPKAIEMTENLKKKISEVQEANGGSVVDAFVEIAKDSIAASDIPEDFVNIDEIHTVKLEVTGADAKDFLAAINSLKVNFKFVSADADKKDDSVFFAFSIPGAKDNEVPAEWALVEGKVSEDGSVDAVLSNSLVESLLGDGSTLVTITK